LIEKLNFFQKAVGNLFENRRRELRGFEFQTPGGKKYLPLDNSKIFTQKSKLEWLAESVSQISKINVWLWKKTKEGSSIPAEIALKGSEMELNFFIDLQQFEVLSNKDISFFLNMKKQCILYHHVAIFHIAHSTMGILYSNFMDDFIRESSPNLQIAGIVKCESKFLFPFNLYPICEEKIHLDHSSLCFTSKY
jgi:hypothetical protein